LRLSRACTEFPNDYAQLACNGYILGLRDIRGIGTSFKITPEVSSPVNEGLRGFGPGGL